MGVNAGAFFGILLCGYLGEKVGWSWGFGLAGIFMFFGLVQFWLAQDIFGEVGKKPLGTKFAATDTHTSDDKLNPFTPLQLTMAGIAGFLGFAWALNDPISKISEGKYNLFSFSIGSLSGSNIAIITALLLFLTLVAIRLPKYTKEVGDRMLAVLFFCIITIFFWAIFEQSPSSLTIFAKDYTNRVLTGGAGLTFKIVNSMMTLIPLGVITWVLALLFKQTFARYSWSNIVLSFSFVIIWGISLWMLYTEFMQDITEVPASWFGVLNSLFIITLAPLFSKWWESKYNPNANGKYAIGMLLLALGMAFVAIGAGSIPVGAKTASVSMIWLILVYLFHTMGELCVSPVSLSYVSKLVPGRMIAFMFGIYYLAIAIGMKLAGVFGEISESIAAEKGISYFFWMLTFIALGMSVFAIVFRPVVKKLMHGVN
jgi:POT family proton-dependent oligopeptide transporter